jgi:RNA polymerase primary sigma factor
MGISMQKSRIINTDEVQSYLKDLKKIPVITHEREVEIFKELKTEGISKKDSEKLRNELVVGNLRFVVSIAKQYQSQGMDLIDLISEGNMGLLKSVDRFDPSSGLKFISYAVWWIKQSMMAALNEHSRTIRIPSNLIQETQKHKREGSPTSYDNPDNTVTELSYSLPYCVGLNREINEDGDELIDIIRDPNEQNPEDVFISPDEIKKRVAMILRVLDDREKAIIEKYFGLNGVESNLDDLGEEFNCTKERIRQLKDKAIKKLRNESYFLLNYLS